MSVIFEIWVGHLVKRRTHPNSTKGNFDFRDFWDIWDAKAQIVSKYTWKIIWGRISIAKNLDMTFFDGTKGLFSEIFYKNGWDF